MSVTDLVISAFLLLHAVIGLHQGLLRAIIGPVGLALAIIIGITYYNFTHNFMVSGLISFFGQMIIPWLLGKFLKFGLNQFDPPEIHVLSRLGGMAVTLAWGCALTALAITLLALFPFNRFELENASKDIHRSIALSVIKPTLIKKGILPNDAPAETCSGDSCQMKEMDTAALANDPEIQSLLKDPRLIKLMNDTEALKDIESRDFKRILSNPVIRELQQDPKFLLKILKIYPKIQPFMNKK